MICKRSTLTCGMALLGCCLFMLAGAGTAWSQAATAKRVSVSFNQTPIQTALKSLFTQVGINYSLDPSVTGYVTASLRDVSFSVALHAVMNANRPQLTYQIQDGVYQIRPKYSVQRRSAGATPAPSAAQATLASGGKTAVRIPLIYGNAAQLMMYALGGGRAIPPTSPFSRGQSASGARQGSGFRSGGRGGYGGGFRGSQGGGGRIR